jgi:hypothetical protein
MKLLRNSGNERVIDRLREWIKPDSSVDLMSPEFSLYAFAETQDILKKVGSSRILLGSDAAIAETLFGGSGDIAARGKLQGRWLAKMASEWLGKQAEVRHALKEPPQSIIVVSDKGDRHVVTGTCSFSTGGLGIAPGDQLGLIQQSDTDAEADAFGEWFQTSWHGVKPTESQLAARLADAASQRPPSLLYFKVLYELFRDIGDELDEERIIKSATGIRNTTVWK